MNMQPKDFQQATADRILQIFRDEGQNRVLLADEVGLGKTIVASAVVGRVSQWHKERNDDHFKVIYVCSNISIANQNCRKLGIAEEDCLNVSESRLSMQHLKIYQNAGRNHHYQQLIPLTPATSFTMMGGQGNMWERALIYVILRRFRGLGRVSVALSDLMKYDRTIKSWDGAIAYFEGQVTQCDQDTDHRYLSDMIRSLESAVTDQTYQEILDYCTGGNLLDEGDRRRKSIVNHLRRVFAQISLERLEPDLVIMDEFQRFKDLIAPSDDDESGMLAKRFLHDENIKVLLLSATPYKPYSTLDELSQGEEGHYKEFMDVMDFLLYSKDRNTRFHEVWKDYSNQLKELKTAGLTVLLAQKKPAEEAMYGCICRTERNTGGILDSGEAAEVAISEEDILSYAEMHKLLLSLNLGNFPIDYVKSAPYLLSFMNYEIKIKIIKKLGDIGDYSRIKASRTMLLRRSEIDKYAKIPSNNARLEMLMKKAFFNERNGAELLLWIPASKPYYKTDNVFSRNAGYSKVLVFSAWEMAPRMIAAMVSYEAERLTVGKLSARAGMASQRRYFAEETKRRRTVVRLRDETAELVCYPSRTLANLYRPEEYYGLDISQIRNAIDRKVREKIEGIKKKYNVTYGQGGAGQMLELLKALEGYNCSGSLTAIPRGAEELLTNIAIGSPGVCALRIFCDEDLAKEFAGRFVSLFNKQESMAVIDVLFEKREEFYYEDVIRYCAEGNLQAVLDEYAYLLDCKGNDLLEAMSAAFVDTASVQVETRESFGTDSRKSRPRIRTHFAVGYYSAPISEKSVQRTDSIRVAFNSPFRPFVLATTSIGQEGLDFHMYCRRIMHWNLPSNPVDLEQREGRINRYLCHAIRQNIAQSEYGAYPIKGSVWLEMIRRAEAGLKGNHSDLVPYWCLPDDFPYTAKIERIVPMYPMSKDKYRYDRLIEVLSLYRLTLGQPRQEELVEVLRQEEWDQQQFKELFFDLSPHSRLCKV